MLLSRSRPVVWKNVLNCSPLILGFRWSNLFQGFFLVGLVPIELFLHLNYLIYITITATGEFTSGWMLLQKISVFPPFFCWGLTLTTNIRNLRMCLLTVPQLQLVFEVSGPWYSFSKRWIFRLEKHWHSPNSWYFRGVLVTLLGII